MTVTGSDLGTYLGASVPLDTDRADTLIALAVQLCESIISPLPTGADAVVLDVAARAYSNPTNVSQQQAGPFGASYGPVGGGLWLTRQNKATLRRLAGSGGAFSIDILPVDAGTELPWWDINSWGYGVNYGTDWDQTP